MIYTRAKAFQDKAHKAILAYKTEKRKDHESRAALVLTDVYKKNMFRK